ncbi:response regulator [Nitrospira sp. NS4]|uniref:response regulator n=1 Tax=Nitrospira sp. NS4 TaxID=3414498 RepID=UPI003C30CD99
MDGYGKRILVIDDDAGCREVLRAQLEHEGYAVQTACDGLAGLDEMGNRRFDAVISDGHTPGLSGLEFAAFSGLAWPDTPVILLSGDLNYLAQSTDQYEAVACIRKPYEVSVLLSVLRTATQPVSRNQALFPMV